MAPDRMGLPFDRLLVLDMLSHRNNQPSRYYSLQSDELSKDGSQGPLKEYPSHRSPQWWPAQFVERLKGFGYVAQWVRAFDASSIIETSLHHGVK